MLGYRTGETPVAQTHVKRPKPFKWLRKLFRRLKFKHARFDDGKFARGQKDIEKWHEEAPLAKADYPDHRWQAATRPRKTRSRNRDTHHSQQAHEDHRNVTYHSRRDEANILDMDLLKQVLEKDPGYSYGKDTYVVSPTARAEMHRRPSKLTNMKKRSKEVVGTTSRVVEETVRAGLTGYFPLEADHSPSHTSLQTTHPKMIHVQAEINAPVLTGVSLTKNKAIYRPARQETSSNTKVVPMPRPKQHSSIPHGTEPSLLHKDQNNMRDIEVIPKLDIIPCQHENDNDLNHMKALDRKVFNKKPKSRKSKKRRARRKGKYRELVSTPSVESLSDLEVQVPEQFRGQSVTRKCKPVKSRKTKKVSNKDVPGSLRRLIITMRNIPYAPVFHPKKYRGYTRFE